MSSRYLEVAQKIISARGRPLTAQQILREARYYDMLPDELFGETMHKTLQARITEDIIEHRELSAFYRTGPGVYFLRKLSTDPALSATLSEFTTRGRARPASIGRMLHFSPAPNSEELVWVKTKWMVATLQRSGIYLNPKHNSDAAFAVGTFTIIRRGDQLFNFKVGKHSPFADTTGKISIGLRRYIDEYDRDLFSADDFGVDMSAAREIVRNVSHNTTDRLQDERSVRGNLASNLCLIDYSERAAWFILEIEADSTSPTLDNPIRRLDITKPRWSEVTSIDINALDRVSRHVFVSRMPA